MSGSAFIVVSGSVAKDPELKYAQSGVAVLKLSVPVDGYVNKEKTVEWYNVTCFGKVAERVSPLIHKGTVVSASGSLNVRTYERSDGSTGVSVDVTANDVKLLSNFGKGERAEEEDKQTEDTDLF